MAVISVPKSLREQLGDQGADDLIELLNRALDESRDGTLALAEEKFERRLSEESSKLNQRISEEANRLDQRINTVANRLDQRITDEVASLRTELLTHAERTKADLIRWMFLFWGGQLAAISSASACPVMVYPIRGRLRSLTAPFSQ